MSKVTFLLSFLILIGGFLFWFDQTTETLRSMSPGKNQSRPPSSQQTQPLPSLREISNIDSDFGSPLRSSSSSSSSSSRNTPTRPMPELRDRLFSEVVALEQELEASRSELLLRQEKLDSLQEQQQNMQKLSGSSTEQEVDTQTADIENLSNLLQAYRDSENNIARRTEAALRIQDEAAQLEKSRLEEQIRALESSIQGTQTEIQAWSQNLQDVTARDVRLTELRNQLMAQAQLLENLRSQRLQISARNLSETQSLYATAQAEQDALSDSQIALQEEIINRRNQVQRLKRTEDQASRKSQDLTAQIERAQKSVKQQTDKIRQIELSIRNKRQQMSSL